MKVRHRIPFRVIAAFAIAALEVAGVLGIMVLLCRHVPYFYLAALLTEIGCVIRIIASDDNPDYKVPWLLIVLVVPIAGFMLYFMFYSRSMKKKYIRRLQSLREDTFARDGGAAMAQLRQEQPLVYGQARMLCAMAETHLYTDTRQTYYPLGDCMLSCTTRTVRMTTPYLIIDNDLCQSIENAAQRGVDVRIFSAPGQDFPPARGMKQVVCHRKGVCCYADWSTALYHPGYLSDPGGVRRDPDAHRGHRLPDGAGVRHRGL